MSSGWSLLSALAKQIVFVTNKKKIEAVIRFCDWHNTYLENHRNQKQKQIKYIEKQPRAIKKKQRKMISCQTRSEFLRKRSEFNVLT